MDLNGISLIRYDDTRPNGCVFILEGTLQEALALDGQTLTIEANKQTVAVFAGHAVTGVAQQGDYVRMTTARKLEASTEAAITAIEANVKAVREAGERNEQTAVGHAQSIADLQMQVDDQASAIEELGPMAASTDVQDQLDEQAAAIEELAALVATDSKEEANG